MRRILIAVMLTAALSLTFTTTSIDPCVAGCSGQV